MGVWVSVSVCVTVFVISVLCYSSHTMPANNYNTVEASPINMLLLATCNDASIRPITSKIFLGMFIICLV